MTQYGQASVLNNEEWGKLFRATSSETYKLIWALMRYTGARISEILQLQVNDCYSNPTDREPFESILYRKETRKGKDKNHQVPVCSALRQILQAYPVSQSGFMFPSTRSQSGHLSYESVYKTLRRCADQAGLSHKRITTHTGRRSLITSLSERGTDLRTIQAISGHSSLVNLQRYIEKNPNRAKAALEAI